MARPFPIPTPADSDRALVARFAADRDPAAFAALVERHGPMVLGVCRRGVRDAHLAEDAFQATFLLLARRADALRDADAVGNWLFGAARQVAANARRRERRVADRSQKSEVRNQKTDAEADVLAALDEELDRLPDRLRAPLVACYLQARTQDAAARDLGWSVSTLRRRLDRGRDLLRARLTARGAVPAATLLATVPPPLARAAVDLAGGTPAPHLLALTHEGFRMTAGRWVLAALVASAAVGGLALVAAPPDRPPEPPAKWMTIKGRVVFPADKPLPVPGVVAVTADKEHCLSKGPLADDAVQIDPKTRGVKNVWVYLRPSEEVAEFTPDDIHPDRKTAKPVRHEVDQPCCQFVPRVFAARTGDTVRFKNSSPIPHNVNYATDDGNGFNTLTPPGQDAVTKPLAAQRSPAAFACNIHPWMHGRFMIFDHPYFAVTAADGSFEIKDVPRAAGLRVVYRHENGFHKGRAGAKGWPVDPKPDARGVAELPAVAFEWPN